MKILLLNQAFYPDVVSTAQHAADLCARLVEAGHEVTVIASRRAYDDPRRSFPRRETWKGVEIRRVHSFGLGKRAAWRRIVDFAAFHFGCALELVRRPKSDVVIAMTTPPMIGFVASLFARRKGERLLYWVMDLNPDEAVATGVLAERSAAARVLHWMLRVTLQRSARIVALDRFMQTRLVAKGAPAEAIHVLPPWSHDQCVSYDEAGREAFRRTHGLQGKFVVMYSGNHSPCHPLDTLLGAALQLAGREEIAFCFVGGGAEHGRVQNFALEHSLKNVLCLPYQPIEHLSASLSSADLHVVVMGDALVGIVHPCKIYNIMLLGSPVLYIGPADGHIPDLARSASNTAWFHSAGHGQVDLVVNHILAAVAGVRRNPEPVRIAAQVSAGVLLNRLISLIEEAGGRGLSPANRDVAPAEPASV